MIPKLDRYISREMLFPFLLAVALLSLYILLNLMVLLSDFMLDRNVSFGDLFRVLLYRLPELVVLALPISVLFATFLSLGRLAHDLELVALQASGISLRRALVPVVAFGLAISVVTFVLNDQVTPWATQQYQRLLRQLVVRGAVPQIQDNTVFKDASGRFFYVRRYDRDTQVMQDVLVYDPNGRTYLPQLGSPYPQMVTATQAVWDGQEWLLSDGVAHVFDADGKLAYQAEFDTLTIEVGNTIQNLFVEQRQPREMSLAELSERIQVLQTAGQPISDLIVEFQTKLVVPLSALVYALIAAPVSLSFGFRGRAAGIIVSVLLTGMFQGMMFYSQTLARRELLDPVWGPWLPNLFFGVLGLILILNVDRLSRLELGRWFQRSAVFVLVPLLGWGMLAHAQAGGQAGGLPQDVPIDIKAQAMEIVQDGSMLRAQGGVQARYGEQTLFAEEVRLRRLGEDRWRLSASGGVIVDDPALQGAAHTLEVLLVQTEAGVRPVQITLDHFEVQVKDQAGTLKLQAEQGVLLFSEALDAVQLDRQAHVELDQATLTADRIEIKRGEEGRWAMQARGGVRFEGAAQQVEGEVLELEVVVVDGRSQVEALTLSRFQGDGTFTNAAGELHALRYEGETARLTFQDEALTRLDLEHARFTTCTCADAIAQASYSISGKRITLWTDEWLFAQDIILKASGVSVFWLPVFLAPLQDLEQNAFFPEIGQDLERGWYAQWRLPVFLDDANRGTFLIDYYHRYREIGLGLDWQYMVQAPSNAGSLFFYHLLGRYEQLDLAWRHQWHVSDLANLSWSLNRRTTNPSTAAPSQWAYDVDLSGGAAGWSWQLSVARLEITQEDEREEQVNYQVLEKTPELALSYSNRLGVSPVFYGGSLSWGRYREERNTGILEVNNERFDVSANASLSPYTIQSPSLTFSASTSVRHSLYNQGTQRTGATLQVNGQWRPAETLSATASYALQAVKGVSPFEFDELSVTNALSGRLNANAFGIDLSAASRYSFHNQQFDPLTVSLTKVWEAHTLQGTLRTLPDQLSVDSVRLHHAWGADWGRWTAAGGYALGAGRFEDLIAKLSLGDRFHVGARFDLNQMRLRRTNAEMRFELGPWSLSFQGEYDWFQQRFSALQLGLVHRFCKNCWEAGIRLNGQRIWLHVQINAFPGVGVTYSPTDGALSFN